MRFLCWSSWPAYEPTMLQGAKQGDVLCRMATPFRQTGHPMDRQVTLLMLPLGSQVVLSHTPMRALAARLAGQCVLVSGRHDVINVAASYGFRKLLSTAQLAAALPGALPFMGRAAVAPSTAAAGAGRQHMADFVHGADNPCQLSSWRMKGFGNDHSRRHC
jgi:hypothetical protein